MSRTFVTTVRFNLDREADRQALRFLQGLGRQVYRTGNQAVIAALNNHFTRLENQARDPYLETREKEDAFLNRVLEVIIEGLKQGRAAEVPQGATAQTGADEDMDEAMTFIDGL